MAGHGGKREGSGRPRIVDELKGFSLARPHVEDAFRVLVEIMLDDKKRPADRISSAKTIIEYACGKPKENVDITSDGDKLDFNIKDLFSVGVSNK